MGLSRARNRYRRARRGGNRSLLPLRLAKLGSCPMETRNPVSTANIGNHPIHPMLRLVGWWMFSTWETASVPKRRAACERAGNATAVPGGCPIVLDGLAFGALPEA